MRIWGYTQHTWSTNMNNCSCNYKCNKKLPTSEDLFTHKHIFQRWLFNKPHSGVFSQLNKGGGWVVIYSPPTSVRSAVQTLELTTGQVGSCFPMVGSLPYRTLTNCMYWFPLPIKLPVVTWHIQCVESDVKTQITKSTENKILTEVATNSLNLPKPT